MQRRGIGIGLTKQVSSNVQNVYGDPKKLAHFVLYALTPSHIDQFSNLFQCQNQENICNNTVTEDLTVIMCFLHFFFIAVISFSLHAMLPLLANKDEYKDPTAPQACRYTTL